MVLAEIQMDYPDSRGVQFAEIIDILQQPESLDAEEQSVIWVTSTNKAGNLHPVPLWFVLDRGTMYATCSPSSKIGRNLLSNNLLTATVTHQADNEPNSKTMIVITANATIGVDVGGKWNRVISGKYLPPEAAKKRGDKGEANPEVLISIPINTGTTEGFTFPTRK